MKRTNSVFFALAMVMVGVFINAACEKGGGEKKVAQAMTARTDAGTDTEVVPLDTAATRGLPNVRQVRPDDLNAAIAAYENFLKEFPKSLHKAEVENGLRQLRERKRAVDEQAKWDAIREASENKNTPLAERLVALRNAQVPNRYLHQRNERIAEIEAEIEWEREATSLQPAKPSPLYAITCKKGEGDDAENFEPDFGTLLLLQLDHMTGSFSTYEPGWDASLDPGRNELAGPGAVFHADGEDYNTYRCLQKRWHDPPIAAAAYAWIAEKANPRLTHPVLRFAVRHVANTIADGCSTTPYATIAAKAEKQGDKFNVVESYGHLRAFCYRRWRDAGGPKDGDAGIRLMNGYLRRIANDMSRPPPKPPAAAKKGG